MGVIEQINWEKTGGLLPVVVQSVEDNQVLMVAYMDREALQRTLETGYAHYYSRSRRKIWKKGEQSGHTQRVKELYLDCDNDTLLLKVEQKGVACHTGRQSCFFKKVEREGVSETLPKEVEIGYKFLDTLYHLLLERKQNGDTATSYTAQLFQKGENSILKKVVEEAGEFTFAVKDRDPRQIVYEGADLLFHLLVALAYRDIHPEALIEELKRRQGISGLEEKRNRIG
jgi:phosphoribosyl-ATP pyrophosphohydrolase/phosphoribosyl-AMP cyclohydrolase